MDFPNTFKPNAAFVSSLDEVKQMIESILINPVRSFLQNGRMGSTVPIHTDDPTMLEFGITSSLEQMSNVTLDHIEYSNSDTVSSVKIYVKYNDVDLVITHNYEN